ncbi:MULTISPECIES: hypothetical protein [Nocardiopsis]|uniref:Uncharacterized protein n=1 Tax=Nocardiopsis sinuspersici TaxID=501010 RepID=A0A1V3BYZ3_9ACTN|nr:MULTISPECIES: hypothetical protein [Nocardiopsis]NYH55041.1 hypothetical protein [Nocardiopsis sinuspersici]OOC53761.1 hypothetical protein NOSIN_08070 [Nocardiopsis sinuspersici]
MYFHPPTFDPGPAATLIGLGLLLAYVVLPPLMLVFHRRLRKEVAAGRREGIVRSYRAALWLSLAEILVVALFVGSAASVGAADIGLSPPAVQWADGVFGNGAILFPWLLLAVFAAINVSNGRKAADPVHRAALARSLGPAQAALMPADGRENRWGALGLAVSMTTQVLVFYVVFYPLFMVFFGDPLPVVVALALLETWAWLGRGFGTMLIMGYFSAMVLATYAWAVPGCLLVPLVFWGVFAGANAMAGRGWYGHTEESYTPPLEVTVLDADGDPVQRPGR